MFKKIIWVVVELVTIAIGTGIFVTSTLDNRVNEEGAGIGAFMIVLGLLLRSWKESLFTKKLDQRLHKANNSWLKKGLIMIIVFTLWGMNYGNIQDNSSDIGWLQYAVDRLEDNSHYH